MRRWDGLVESYLRWCEGRGLAKATLDQRERELTRWGVWLKRRRPRPALEAIDQDLIVEYVRQRSAFRARATVAGVVSHVRGMGEHLAREGVWTSNVARWVQGPKMDQRSRRPRGIARGVRAGAGARNPRGDVRDGRAPRRVGAAGHRGLGRRGPDPAGGRAQGGPGAAGAGGGGGDRVPGGVPAVSTECAGEGKAAGRARAVRGADRTAAGRRHDRADDPPTRGAGRGAAGDRAPVPAHRGGGPAGGGADDPAGAGRAGARGDYEHDVVSVADGSGSAQGGSAASAGRDSQGNPGHRRRP